MRRTALRVACLAGVLALAVFVHATTETEQPSNASDAVEDVKPEQLAMPGRQLEGVKGYCQQKVGGACSNDKGGCCSDDQLCKMKTCCIRRNKACYGDNNCCGDDKCIHGFCKKKPRCAKTGEDCADSHCCRDTDANCVSTYLYDEKKCCKAEDKECQDDKECCYGGCFKKEDDYGTQKSTKKFCLVGTCEEQGKKPTGAGCQKDWDCCGAQTGLQKCNKGGKCCREEHQPCEMNQHCCTGHCDKKKQVCTTPPKKECTKLGETCKDDMECCEKSKTACRKPVWDGTEKVCCRELKNGCRDDYDCCSGICHNKKCVPCIPEHEECDSKSECCGNNECTKQKNGKHLCKKPCGQTNAWCMKDDECCEGKECKKVGRAKEGVCKPKETCKKPKGGCNKDKECCGDGKCERHPYSNLKTCCNPVRKDCKHDDDCCSDICNYDSEKCICKRIDEECKDDKNCCKGSCKQEVTDYGEKTYKTTCQEGENCLEHGKKATGEYCEKKEHCCGDQECKKQPYGHYKVCCRETDKYCKHGGDCCSGICDDYKCKEAPCKDIHSPCDGPGSCCEGQMCKKKDPGYHAKCCWKNGQECTYDGECCSDSCRDEFGGMSWAKKRYCAEKKDCMPTYAKCEKPSDCCGFDKKKADSKQDCQGYQCCRTEGQWCSEASQCCSKDCKNHMCQKADKCQEIGEKCTYWPATPCCKRKDSYGNAVPFACQWSSKSYGPRCCVTPGVACKRDDDCCNGVCIPPMGRFGEKLKYPADGKCGNSKCTPTNHGCKWHSECCGYIPGAWENTAVCHKGKCKRATGSPCEHRNQCVMNMCSDSPVDGKWYCGGQGGD